MLLGILYFTLVIFSSFHSKFSFQFPSPYGPYHMKFKISATVDSILSTSKKADRKSNFEDNLKAAIINRKLDDALCILSKEVNETSSGNLLRFNNGRSAVYMIGKFCNDYNRNEFMVPLLKSLKSINQAQEYDVYPYVSDCVSKKRSMSGFDLIRYLEDNDVKLSIKLYSMLLQGIGRTGKSANIDNFLDFCLTKRVSMDLIFMHNVMDSYIRCNNVPNCLLILTMIDPIFNKYFTKDMNTKSYDLFQKFNSTSQKLSFRPNVRTFNILLKGLRNLKSNYFDYKTILNDMKTKNIEPDFVTINTAVDVAVSTKSLIQAEELLRHPFATPTVEAFTALVTGYADIGDSNGASRTFEMMIDRNILPNSFTLTSLMTAFIKSGNITAARSLLSKEKDSYFAKLTNKDQAIVYGSFIIGLCNLAVSASDESKYEYTMKAMLSLLSMYQRKLYPDIATLNAFIRAVCKSQVMDIKDALELVKAMKLDGIQPDAFTYGIVMSALGKFGYTNEAFQLFSILDEFIDTTNVNIILKVAADSSNPIQALQFYYDVLLTNHSISDNILKRQTLNFTPNKITFNTLFFAIYRSFNENGQIRYLDSDEIRQTDIHPQIKSNFNKFVLKLVRREQDKVIHVYPNAIAKVVQKMILKLNDTVDENNNSNNEDVSNKKSFLFSQQSYDFISKGPNIIVRDLYRSMKFDYNIVVDDKLLSVLNQLFTTSNTLQQQTPMTQKLQLFLSEDSFESFQGFNENLARFIFDDLIISGYSPQKVIPILKACKFSAKKTKELLVDFKAIDSLRSSAASVRIFQKHGWNSMDSSWTPF